jgi:sugar lactone lactonase YvrE
MKQKLTIFFALLLILVAVFFMARDFFFQQDKDTPNPYEYDLSEFREVEEDLICYKEVARLAPLMKKAKGIAVDDKDRLYVAGADKVIIYDKGGEKVQEFKLDGEANCIAVSMQGEIYLGMSDHVEIRDFSGNLLQEWADPGERTLISSITVSDSAVYVADAGHKVVRQYNLSGSQIREIGKRNRATGEQGFIIPSPYFDVMVGREGELWAVNPGIHTLQSYNNEGSIVSSWKRTSMQLDGFSGCCNPSHIAMLSNGSFVTSEKGIERVKVHLPSGDFKCVVAGPKQFEPGTVGLDLAVDSEDRIYVLDPKKKEVIVYEGN